MDELSVAARSRVANAEIIIREAPMLMRAILLILRPCLAETAAVGEVPLEDQAMFEAALGLLEAIGNRSETIGTH